MNLGHSWTDQHPQHSHSKQSHLSLMLFQDACNSPKIFQQYILKIHDDFFFSKNFSRVSFNLAYPKLSTKSISIPNQPLSTIQCSYYTPTYLNQQYFTFSNISTQRIIILLKWRKNYLNHDTQTIDYRFNILPSIIYNLLSTVYHKWY